MTKTMVDMLGCALARFVQESAGEGEEVVFIYRQRDRKTGAFIDADNRVGSPHLCHLYAHLTQNRFIEPLRGVIIRTRGPWGCHG